ncbi:MAG: hypothetical protein JXA52_05405, partial [Planctomycetes bacterium]|nr:hypothetical protein [Planctomycetota bacterium]
MRKRRIVITMGDPAGIGPEIIAKAFTHKKLLESAHLVVLGNRWVMEETCDRLELKFPFQISRGQKPNFSEVPLLVEADSIKDA